MQLEGPLARRFERPRPPQVGHAAGPTLAAQHGMPLCLKARHRLRPRVAVQHGVLGIQRVQTPPAALDALLQGANLGAWDVVGVVEGHHGPRLRRVIDVGRYRSHPALWQAAGDVLAQQAQLGLPVVPVQLLGLGAFHKAHLLHLYVREYHVEAPLLGVLGVQRGRPAGGHLVGGVQRVGPPRPHRLLSRDVLHVQRHVRTGPGVQRPHLLSIAGGGELDVPALVGVADVVPLRMEHPRMALLDIRVVGVVAAIPSRLRRRQLVGRRHLIPGAHRVGVAEALLLPPLRDGQLDVRRGEAQVPRAPVHWRVVGPCLAPRVHRISAAHTHVRLV
mmetsp:Transcript_51195/g.122631  ORF Transcript_51195/g.122631 Transcript_51195/m.122631 type:complete len:332 (+) Transcript_51195:282-1277(+)